MEHIQLRIISIIKIIFHFNYLEVEHIEELLKGVIVMLARKRDNKATEFEYKILDIKKE